MRLALLAVLLAGPALSGCRCDPEHQEQVPAPEPRTLPRADPGGNERIPGPIVDRPLLDPGAVDDELPSEDEVDAMDQAELQAACFNGSQAACDRLGH